MIFTKTDLSVIIDFHFDEIKEKLRKNLELQRKEAVKYPEIPKKIKSKYITILQKSFMNDVDIEWSYNKRGPKAGYQASLWFGGNEIKITDVERTTLTTICDKFFTDTKLIQDHNDLLDKKLRKINRLTTKEVINRVMYTQTINRLSQTNFVPKKSCEDLKLELVKLVSDTINGMI